MATKDEALKMAIEYIQQHEIKLSFDNLKAKQHTLQACKEALEQPAQEPVAYIKQGMDGYPSLVFNGKFEYASIAAKWDDIALYIHPAPSCQECENLKHDIEGYMDANKKLINREWQGLSDDEIVSIWVQAYDEKDIRQVCRAIEQALRNKNGT